MFLEKEDSTLVDQRDHQSGTGAHEEHRGSHRSAELQKPALFYPSMGQGPKWVSIHQRLDSARGGIQKHSEGFGGQGE